MRTTKLLASLIVVCMLATCMFCIAGTDDTNGDVIRSKDCVVINVDKPFEDNKTELAKLGITSYKSWHYSDDYGCYVLILDNVHFKTTSLDGLLLISESDKANPKIVIELVGNNSIVSGTNETQELQYDEVSCAIVGAHFVDDDNVGDLNVIITGDGTLEVTNADLSNKIIGTYGIYVYGSLTICDGAKVIAAGSGFEHACTAEHAVKMMEMCSCGVYVEDKLTVSDAVLLASGGDTNVVFEKQEQADKTIYYYSKGIIAAKYLIEDSYVLGVGGKVDWNTMKDDYIASENFKILSYSEGIATLEDYFGKEEYVCSAEIRNSKVVGSANTAKGINYAKSSGISLESADTIPIVDSIIIGTSGDVFITGNVENPVVETYGIYLDDDTAIKGSFVRGVSGNHASQMAYGIAAGINCPIINADDSIIVAVELAQLKGLPFGILAYEFNIIDSEVYAKGVDQAIGAVKLNASLGNRGCYSLDNDGNRTAIDVSGLTGEHTAVELLYAYDVLIGTVDGKLISFERSESEYYVVGPYSGFVPDGMKFTGYEETDGDAVNIGDTFVVDEPLILVATFGVADEPDSGNAVVAWIIVIVALIVVALLVVGLCVSRKLKG